MDLERDAVDSDAQGRLLRYVYLDGSMVNAALIAVGMGTAATGQNVRYAEGFRRLEAQARSEQLGIWANQPEETPTPSGNTPGPLNMIPRRLATTLTLANPPRTTGPPARQTVWGALFGDPAYRRLWAMGATTNVMRWLETVALGFFVYELTGSPFWVALRRADQDASHVRPGRVRRRNSGPFRPSIAVDWPRRRCWPPPTPCCPYLQSPNEYNYGTCWAGRLWRGSCG